MYVKKDCGPNEFRLFLLGMVKMQLNYTALASMVQIVMNCFKNQVANVGKDLELLTIH